MTVTTALAPVLAAVREGLPDRLARMIQLRTVSADLEQTGPAPFEVFQDLLRELYPLAHERLTREVIDGLGLLYRWEGRTPQAPVVLMAHYDTVDIDPNDDWAQDPFGGRIVDGAVWGRGTLDDKGPLCVLFEAVENLLVADFVPERDIYVVSAGDEEVAGSAAKAMAEELHARGVTPWLVLDEGGAVIDGVVPTLDIPSAMVGLGEKGNLSVRISATGDVGHASSPSSKLSAIDRVARAVTRSRRVPFPVRLDQATRTMFTLYRSRATGVGKAVTTLIPRAPALSARLLTLLGGEAAAAVRTTVVTTMLDAGTAPNMLASRASATLSLGIALGESADGALECLKHGLRDPQLTYQVLGSREPSLESSASNAQWQLVAEAVEVSHPGVLAVPYVSLGGTDSRHFHPYTPEATYRFAPLYMSEAQREGVHGVNEHVNVESLRCGEVFYRALIQSLPRATDQVSPATLMTVVGLSPEQVLQLRVLIPPNASPECSPRA